jgi:protein TonB
VQAPPPPPAPVVQPAAVNIGVACPTRALPKLTAKQEGVQGTVRARLTIKGGRVINVDILSSTPKGLFDSAVRSAVMQYGCQTDGDQTVVAEQTFSFTAE